MHHLNYFISVFYWWLSTDKWISKRRPIFSLILCNNFQEILNLLCSSKLPWEIPPHLTTGPYLLHQASQRSAHRPWAFTAVCALESYLPTALRVILFFISNCTFPRDRKCRRWPRLAHSARALQQWLQMKGQDGRNEMNTNKQ